MQNPEWEIFYVVYWISSHSASNRLHKAQNYLLLKVKVPYIAT